MQWIIEAEPKTLFLKCGHKLAANRTALSAATNPHLFLANFLSQLP